MKVKFWGVRGSVPTPWAEAMQVGGNTSCVELLTDLDAMIILDAGTGLRLLGKQLIAQQKHQQRQIHLLLTHTHWDHIQGLPFFGLLNYAGNQIDIYGADKPDRTLEEVLCTQMSYAYFPVALYDSAAQIRIHAIPPGRFSLGPVQIEAAPFQHPGSVYAYRITYQGHTLVYATDMEYPPEALDPRLVDFARQADLLIYDAQYTPEEYQIKRGWGHSTHLSGPHLARQADVGQLFLYSHDPEHSDRALEAMEAQAREIFPATRLAREGLTVPVSRHASTESAAFSSVQDRTDI